MSSNAIDLMHPDRVKVRNKFKKNPEFFMKQIGGRGKFKYPFGAAHKIIIHTILFSMYFANLILAWRKLGKSTIIFSGIIPYLILVEKARCIYVTSETAPSVKRFLRQIKSTLKGPGAMALYGDVEGSVWTITEIHVCCPALKIDCWVISGGRKGQVSGMSVEVEVNGRIEIVRPEWIFGDDYDVPQGTPSPALVKKQVDHYNNALKYCVDNQLTSRIFMIGTYYSPSSFLTAFGDMPSVNVVKLPVINVASYWPEIEKKYGIGHWESLWEESPEFCAKVQKKKYYEESADHSLDSYSKQMLLEILLDDKMRFKTKQMIDIDSSEIDYSKLNLYLLIDAGYTQNSWSDPTAISLVGVGKDFKYYLIDAVEEKMSEAEVLGVIADMYVDYNLERYMFQGIYVESTMFPWVESMFERELMANFGIRAFIFELKTENKTKVFRIRAFIHPTNKGDVYITQNAKIIRAQMQAFHGDGPQPGINALDATAHILMPDISDEPALPDTPDEIAAREREASDERWRELLGRSAFNYGTYGKVVTPSWSDIAGTDIFISRVPEEEEMCY